MRFIYLVSLIFFMIGVCSGSMDPSSKSNLCLQQEKKSRKKRTVELPNQTSLTFSSRLVVPQQPVGLYIIWIRVNLFVRSMFTQSTHDTISVKRLHSRHRRNIAPGAIWDILVGVQVVWPRSSQLMFDIIIKYELDYLFGGAPALAGAIAGNNAAATASASATAAAIAAAQAAAAAAAAANGRKKRSSPPLNTGGGTNANLFGRKKRNTHETLQNILTRSLADDQADILGRLEDSLTRGGLNGRECVLRAICELAETPIHHWSLVGEMMNTLFSPKKDNHTRLTDYQKAEQFGEEQGDCWNEYSECSLSIFNFIPDVYTTDDELEVTLSGLQTGNDVVNNDDILVEESSKNSNTKEMKIDLDITL